MKETRMPPAYAANLVANSGNTIYGVSVIDALLTNDLSRLRSLCVSSYYNMPVWILAGNDIIFSIAAGLIRRHMPGLK